MLNWVWVHYARPRPSWYGTNDDAKQAMLEQCAAVTSDSEAAGARKLGHWSVRGQSDFSTVEIWEFPSAEAALSHWDALAAIGYRDLFTSANSIGMRLQEVARPATDGRSSMPLAQGESPEPIP